MAQLLVRNIEESVKKRLRARAKSNGRSMEEELRLIIREAVSVAKPKEGLGTRLVKHFAGKVPEDFKVVEIRGNPRIPDFEE